VLVPLHASDYLERGALAYPERTALVDEPAAAGSLGRITYAEFQQRVWGVANRLSAMGVGVGERVAILSPNSARFVVSLFGVGAFGRIFVPINYRLNATEVSYILEHSGAKVVLVDPEFEHLVPPSDGTTRVLLDDSDGHRLFEPVSAAPVHAGPAAMDENAVFSVNYTSGTTARPKGVQLTHRNCWLSAAVLGWMAGISDRDVYLHTLPTFHCNGWGLPFALTAMGVKQVIVRKIDGEEILRRIDAEGVTLLAGAPTVVSAILDAAERRGMRQATPPVRMIVAGAPPPSRVVERLEAELGWEFIQLYGLTETAPLLTLNRAPREWDGMGAGERAKLLSRAGVPALGVRLAVSDDGEILARSNHVFAGYWQQPDETDRAIRDGWFHTGDGGYLDHAHLVVSDRKKDVIITGGENVSSIEVEDVLCQHPAVAEAAVIGAPHPRWGETVVALVVLRSGADAAPDELSEFCRQRLAHYKCPTSISVRSELPRTATGKLQKFVLREAYSDGVPA
jgi:fatty-acyl-CoA synthase